jgi:polyhydroxyalkanoate synthase
MVSTLDELSSVEKQRLNHFFTQIIEMMSPTNFLAINRAALEKAVATQGQSLVDGLENLVSKGSWGQ